uniref:Ovule protein n=1 Tax=Steinernema glaseri TaxID=37863 RepID=A0A1I7ZK69_9BILA
MSNALANKKFAKKCRDQMSKKIEEMEKWWRRKRMRSRGPDAPNFSVLVTWTDFTVSNNPNRIFGSDSRGAMPSKCEGQEGIARTVILL